MIIKTRNSTYEIDGNRIRRLYGKDNPTPRQGEDGEWKRFEALSLPPKVGEPLGIIWVTNGLVAQTTMTSIVESIEDSEDMN